MYVYNLDGVIGCTFHALQAPLNDQKAQGILTSPLLIQTARISTLPCGGAHSLTIYRHRENTWIYTHTHTHLLLQALKDAQPQVKTDPIFCLLWHRSSSRVSMPVHSIGLSSTTGCTAVAIRAEENCMIQANGTHQYGNQSIGTIWIRLQVCRNHHPLCGRALLCTGTAHYVWSSLVLK